MSATESKDNEQASSHVVDATASSSGHKHLKRWQKTYGALGFQKSYNLPLCKNLFPNMPVFYPLLT